MTRHAVLCLAVLAVVLGAQAGMASAQAGIASAQGQAPLTVRGPEGATASLSVDRSRGYAAVDGETLEGLGWDVQTSASGLRATTADGDAVVELEFGTPLFRWNGTLLQLVDVPFGRAGAAHVPLQLVLDFLPIRLAERYTFLPDEGVLEIRDAALWAGLTRTVPTFPPDGGPGGSREAARSGDASPTLADGRPPTPTESFPGGEAPSAEAPPSKRVVVIDPGHGGKDPGTSGSGGRREKDIALAVGRALARELRRDDGLEVYLTRDRDVLIPLWQRGELATAWKGDRPGVFVSIHANALPGRPGVRGFETYFLSDARTEHERRVAANENAPLRIDRDDGVDGDAGGGDEHLGVILRELRNFDHAHWSSLLAEGVQTELQAVHPGPNRGVKQAPLAVITNALMPAVLVEVGFVTNRAEERILSQGRFQEDLAEAMARAIRGFFERYPPGQDETVSVSRR